MNDDARARFAAELERLRAREAAAALTILIAARNAAAACCADKYKALLAQAEMLYRQGFRYVSAPGRLYGLREREDGDVRVGLCGIWTADLGPLVPGPALHDAWESWYSAALALTEASDGLRRAVEELTGSLVPWIPTPAEEA